MVQFLFHHSTMFNGCNLVGFVNRLTFYNGHNLSRASLFSVDSLFCGGVRLGQGPWPVSEVVQLVEQRTDIPSVVGSSPRPGTNTFLPNVTLLVSEVIRRSASGLNDKGWGGWGEIRLGQGPWSVAQLAQLVLVPRRELTLSSPVSL